MSVEIDCGQTTIKQEISSRIVGGQQAIPHSYPWQVLLSDRGRFCGGKSEFYRSFSKFY